MDPKNSFGPVFFWFVGGVCGPGPLLFWFDRGKMQAVKIILERSGCSDYAEVFEEKGYDSAGHLLAMGPNDLKELQQICGILPGHMHRLRSMLTTLNYQEHVVNQEPAAAAAAAAPSESISGDTEDSRPKAAAAKSSPGLKTVHDTWTEAKLASYAFSTRCGCRALVDTKVSGGKRKILRCETVLTKKNKAHHDGEEQEDEQIPCAHTLYWKKNKSTAGRWVLDESKSHLGHAPFCNSEQKATRFELLNDPSFVKHVRNKKDAVTGQTAAKQAIGGEAGLMDGSVKSRTARRAANDVLKFHDKDYKEDWSKLAEWKREYERKNPQSRCVFQDNPASRVKKMYVCTGPFRVCLCVYVCRQSH